jgi:hypothetical protein
MMIYPRLVLINHLLQEGGVCRRSDDVERGIVRPAPQGDLHGI